MISKRYNEQMGNYLAKLAKASKPQTNADRIRSMTDEELAKFLDCYCVSASWECPRHHKIKCHDCWLEWLKKEAE